MHLSKAKKFSPSDLEMAYVFHRQRGKGAVPKQPKLAGGRADFDGQQTQQVAPHPHYRLDTSPQHVLNTSGQHEQGTLPAGHGPMQLGQSGFRNQMPTRDYPGHAESLGEQQIQNRHDSTGHGMLHQSARFSGQAFGGRPAVQSQQDRDEQRMNMLLASNERQSSSMPNYPNPQGFMTSPEHDKKLMPMQLYPSGDQERQLHAPQGSGAERVLLDASRSSGELNSTGGHCCTVLDPTSYGCTRTNSPPQSYD